MNFNLEYIITNRVMVYDEFQTTIYITNLFIEFYIIFIDLGSTIDNSKQEQILIPLKPSVESRPTKV